MHIHDGFFKLKNQSVYGILFFPSWSCTFLYLHVCSLWLCTVLCTCSCQWNICAFSRCQLPLSEQKKNIQWILFLFYLIHLILTTHVPLKTIYSFIFEKLQAGAFFTMSVHMYMFAESQNSCSWSLLHNCHVLHMLYNNSSVYIYMYAHVCTWKMSNLTNVLHVLVLLLIRNLRLSWVLPNYNKFNMQLQ